MYLVHRALLLIVYFGIVIFGQGGGGHGGSGGGFGGGGYHGSGGGSCNTDECRRNAGIIGGVIGGIFGLILIVVGTLLCCRKYKGRPRQANSIFVKSANESNIKQQTYEMSPYRSGTWSSRYYQYGKWHGPYPLSLSFDDQSMRVSGSGSDDVGAFSIDGTFSTQTQRVGLTKSYRAGTGNSSQNLGHHVNIQLTWNAGTKQFEGKWYVQTNKYHGEDKFELRCDDQDGLPAYAQV